LFWAVWSELIGGRLRVRASSGERNAFQLLASVFLNEFECGVLVRLGLRHAAGKAENYMLLDLYCVDNTLKLPLPE
jgi:hypothetical protein